MGIAFLILYNLLAPIIALAYFIFFLFSSRRGLLKHLLAELKERFAVSVPVFLERPLWFHAASVGEVKAIQQLVPLVRARFPLKPVMITTSTSSGRTEALKLTPCQSTGQAPHAFLLPLDSYPLMRRFMAAARPELLLIAETELWPNLLYAAGHSGVKVMMINARISPRTAGFYELFAPIARLMFRNISRIAVQSRDDFERYKALLGGTDKLALTGNMKHDLVVPKPQDRAEIESFLERAEWKGKRIFCAGSTHPEEENIILEAFLKIRAALPDARLILAPRHPETAASSAVLLREKGLVAPRWSQRAHARPALLAEGVNRGQHLGDKPQSESQKGGAWSGPDCLLVDEIGRLADIYGFSDVVFVGGTLDETGGHNVLEPSAFSKPVLFGPNIKHTRDGAEALINKNGGFMVGTADELADKIISLLKDPVALREAGAASKAALESLQGATAKTLALIEKYL